MGITICHCNKILKDEDILFNRRKYTISEIKKVKIIQAAIRKSLNKIIWKKKIYAMKLKERVKSSFKENIFPLKFNVFWEKNFRKLDVNLNSFNLNKLSKKLENFYIGFFNRFKDIEHEKILLKLTDESHFNTRFSEFISNYKVLILRSLSSYFTCTKSKDVFDKCLVEIDNQISNDISSVHSSILPKINYSEINNELTGIKVKSKNNKTKLEVLSNDDTTYDFQSKLNTQNKLLPQLTTEGGSPYFLQIISNINKEDKVFLEEKEYGSSSFYYDGSFHKELHLNYGIGKMYKFEPHSDFCNTKYYGYFFDNNYHGFGVLVSSDGSVYKGEFREGKKVGYGKEKHENYIYKGFFADDTFCGYGELHPNLKSKDGTSIKYRFKGCFRNGKKEGFGYQFNEDGSRYIGNWKDDKMNGTGLFIWREGHSYYGGWKEDKMSGKGVYKWLNGDVFTGNYDNDLKDGEGEYFFLARNSHLKGKWSKGKKEGVFLLIEGQDVSKIEYFNDQIVVD